MGNTPNVWLNPQKGYALKKRPPHTWFFGYHLNKRQPHTWGMFGLTPPKRVPSQKKTLRKVGLTPIFFDGSASVHGLEAGWSPAAAPVIWPTPGCPLTELPSAPREGSGSTRSGRPGPPPAVSGRFQRAPEGNSWHFLTVEPTRRSLQKEHGLP